MEDAKAAAKHGLVVAAEAVSEPASRADIVAIGPDERPRQVGLIGRERATERDRARREQRRDFRVRHDVVTAVGGDEVREDIVAVDEGADDLVSKAEEQW